MQKSLFAVLFFVLYQVVAQRNQKEIIEDFNQDGINDTLQSYTEGGSIMGGKYLKLIQGKTGAAFEMDNYGCNCQITQPIGIPQSLAAIENANFLKAIKSELIPPQREAPDLSLRWIFEGLRSKKVLTDNPYFDLVFDADQPWQNQKIELPNSYHIQIATASLEELYGNEAYKEQFKKGSESVLVYYAHNHYRNLVEKSTYDMSDLPLAAASETYKVFRTTHGIIVQKGGQYKWLFITEFDLTGGPEKLRWDSIGKIEIINGTLVVQHKVPPAVSDQVFFINIETGISARLKLVTEDLRDFEESDNGGFVIKGKKLLLGFDEDGVLQRLRLKAVLKTFEALNKK